MALLKQKGAESLVRGLPVMTTRMWRDIGSVSLRYIEAACWVSKRVIEPQRQRWVDLVGGDC